MLTRLLLGPAGSGKTFRCLAGIREALAADPAGPPLLLIAPKQTTYQLERQLLARPDIAGYTRLRILSFERLASFVFELLHQPPPRMLGEEGRLMVLRSLLARKRDHLKLFRASARLTGFAQHLSEALRELQSHQLTPESLHVLAARTAAVESLSFKLHDLATLLRDYLDWLDAHALHDADHLLDFATAALRQPHPPLPIAEIWVDGFTEFSPQELALLAEVLPHAARATITFCLDRIPAGDASWLSNWSMVERTFKKCRAVVSLLPDCEVATELLPRRTDQTRFAKNPILAHLEEHWANPEPLTDDKICAGLPRTLQVSACPSPEAEATLAAREILRFTRSGGRFREVTVLARSLEPYHDALAGVFARYEIPFFLDRRESVAHHPLAELTRNALRTVVSSWVHEDWFAALKTGLVPAAEEEIDRLENEALARGWKGSIWRSPIVLPPDEAELARALEPVRKKIVPPFQKLNTEMGLLKNRPNGLQLAAALRNFWAALDVEETLRQWSAQETGPQPIHLTVWEQMNAWLENVELAFADEALPLREWLPILDAGLANLTVGVIPPALDQVLIGAVDRSRNPEIRLALVLGMNETVFPAPPRPSVLLTEDDRKELEGLGIALGSRTRQQLGYERHLGYVACTRARERLVLTHSVNDADGKPLNPSPFLAHLQKLFPALQSEIFPRELDWRDSEHASELIAPLLREQLRSTGASPLARLEKLPALQPLRESLRHFTGAATDESLSPDLAGQLYGPALRTSVSRMEQFAACPFKFFVHSGLRAEERKRFELDVRDQGNFQHEVLAMFHDELRAENKRWRDLTPAEARDRIGRIAASRTIEFRDGLLQSSEQSRFTARVLAESLQDFVETLITWTRRQYAFDPAEVELPFGDESDPFPAWEIDLGEDHRLLLHGRIDRIDLCRTNNADEALCVIVDYKSSQKQLDPILMEHGLQLQLAAYLNALRHWPDPRARFGVSRLIPAGMFYVNLRGRYDRGSTRDEALADTDRARKLAYRHTGRFDAGVLAHLDQRPDATEGDQFNYRRNKDGSLSGASREALDSAAFVAILDSIESFLTQMGRSIYSGVVKVDPFRKGRITACDQCDYRAVCRLDPWTHSYRLLKKSKD